MRPGAVTTTEVGPVASPGVSRETVGPAHRLMAAAERCGAPVAPDDAAWMVSVLDRMGLERQNLTAIDEIADAVDRHLIDSVVGARLPELQTASSLVDLGSGGGFPGLPLARLLTDATVTLVESERRKAAWLEAVGADLPNVRVVADRTEHLAQREREAWTVATARAVAATPALLELAAPLVAVDGALVAWRGPSDAQPSDADHAAAQQLGFRHDRVEAVEPFDGAERFLVVWRKVEPTAARFPRRPGRATKRPLV